MHVLADAFTSILAITALTGGKFFGWAWLDPVVGIIGSVVVFSWSYTLLRDTGGILLDRTPASSDLPHEIRRAVESDGDSVVIDLHVCKGAVTLTGVTSLCCPDSSAPIPSHFMKRFIIAFFAAYIFLFVWGWLINGVLLKDIYAESAHLWRPESEMRSLFHWIIIGQALIVFSFVMHQRQASQNSYRNPRWVF